MSSATGKTSQQRLPGEDKTRASQMREPQTAWGPRRFQASQPEAADGAAGVRLGRQASQDPSPSSAAHKCGLRKAAQPRSLHVSVRRMGWCHVPPRRRAETPPRCAGGSFLHGDIYFCHGDHTPHCSPNPLCHQHPNLTIGS